MRLTVVLKALIKLSVARKALMRLSDETDCSMESSN